MPVMIPPDRAGFDGFTLPVQDGDLTCFRRGYLTYDGDGERHPRPGFLYQVIICGEKQDVVFPSGEDQPQVIPGEVVFEEGMAG